MWFSNEDSDGRLHAYDGQQVAGESSPHKALRHQSPGRRRRERLTSWVRQAFGQLRHMAICAPPPRSDF